jgi:hypothetical protein
MNIHSNQSASLNADAAESLAEQTTQAPEKSGACEDSCEPLKAIEQEPLDRFELSTYALRMAT